MKSVIFIPASMKSSRLPGKPLIDINGKPLVQWTYEAAKRTKADHAVVTSSDREVAKVVQAFGGTFWPTPGDYWCGTQRVSAAAKSLQSGVQTVVNWQVDEPLVDPKRVDRLLDEVRDHRKCICTMASDPVSPSFVNVVRSKNGVCHWFSRVRTPGER